MIDWWSYFFGVSVSLAVGFVVFLVFVLPQTRIKINPGVFPALLVVVGLTAVGFAVGNWHDRVISVWIGAMIGSAGGAVALCGLVVFLIRFAP